jgi:hypothetical protein
MTHQSSDPARKLTHSQLVEIALNDPVAKAASAMNPLVAERRRLYSEDASGLIADLVAAGFPAVREVGELRGLGNYVGAVPILLRWLPEVTYLLLADDIVRTLSVPFAKELAFPLLVRLFQSPPHLNDPLRPPTSEPASEHLRGVLGSALSTFASPSTSDELMRLAIDRSFGESRALIVSALPKTKDARVTEVLLGLLNDPTVAAFAVEALGKLKAHDARDRIAAMLDSSDKNVRDQAKKALKRIDSATR